jgi:uncharacterized membrane protein HdeD (DUF308 family)
MSTALKIRTVTGALIAVVGAVWIVQGVGVLHGSFMTGEAVWAVVGVVVVAIGIAVMLGARRARDAGNLRDDG